MPDYRGEIPRERFREDKREMRRRKRRRFRRRLQGFIGILLILVALVMFAMDPLKNYLIKKESAANQVGNLTREEILRNQQADVTYDFSDIQNIDALEVISDSVNPNHLPVIGGIAIPSLGVNLPIYKGVSNEGMYKGAGTLTPDQRMGESNYPIASHHSIDQNLLFAPLLRAELGQIVYLTDLETIYEYKIDFIESVAPERVDLIQPTEEPILTMITCDYGLVNRFVVRASLVDEVPITHASKEMLEAFEIPQTTAAMLDPRLMNRPAVISAGFFVFSFNYF